MNERKTTVGKFAPPDCSFHGGGNNYFYQTMKRREDHYLYVDLVTKEREHLFVCENCEVN